MIDVTTENLRTLAQAAAVFPGRPSIATLWRWRTKGARGRKLESVILGGRVFTSLEALSRFAEHCGGSDRPTISTPAAREKSIRKAEQELREAGI